MTHDGFYIQKDGLAMGSPPAPHLANGWLSQFEPNIRGEAQLYERYMDDIIRETLIKVVEIGDTWLVTKAMRLAGCSHTNSEITEKDPLSA